MFRMNNSSVFLCGLILSFCSRVTGLNEKLSVIQSPDDITVDEGESAEISCCWTALTNVKVVWLKNETKVSAENRLNQTYTSQNCSTLHITHITSNDAGEYVCKVTKDIPILTEVKGHKTILTVIQHVITEVVPVTSCVLTVKNPDIIKTISKDGHGHLDGHSVDSPNESSDLRDIVVIYIFRCLPFFTLLVAFLYLNRDDKRVIPLKPVEPALEQPESGNKRRNDTEGVKQGQAVSVVQEESDTTEKTEDETDKYEEEREPVGRLDAEDVMVI